MHVVYIISTYIVVTYVAGIFIITRQSTLIEILVDIFFFSFVNLRHIHYAPYTVYISWWPFFFIDYKEKPFLMWFYKILSAHGFENVNMVMHTYSFFLRDKYFVTQSHYIKLPFQHSRKYDLMIWHTLKENYEVKKSRSVLDAIFTH